MNLERMLSTALKLYIGDDVGKVRERLRELMLLALATKKPLGKGLGAYFMESMNIKQLLAGSVLYLDLPPSCCSLQPKKQIVVVLWSR